MTPLVAGEVNGKGTDGVEAVIGRDERRLSGCYDALRNRFEPSSKRERYAAEFRLRKRKNGEQWGDFADQLRCLADKAFPTLSEDTKEVLTLDRYLGELCDANIALAVRQQRPETLEEAVSCTLEMESYALLRKEEPTRVAAVQ